MDHIKPLRLFDLVHRRSRENVFELNEDEKQHLRECGECQQVLVVFTRQFGKPGIGHGKPEDAA
jgi:hypothetical protein